MLFLVALIPTVFGDVIPGTPGYSTELTPSSELSCENPKLCQELDEVWIRLRPLLGFTDPNKEVWQGMWMRQRKVPAGLCFPIMRDSFGSNLNNFGDSRENGGRCHAGIDLSTTGEGKVVAIDNGIVVGILPSFVDPNEGCGSSGAAALLIYHSALGKTINYGELLPDDANKFTVGTAIVRGQYLGRATPCKMLHLEMYEGSIAHNLNWYPPDGTTISVTNQCASDPNILATKPAQLSNPTQFLNSLQGNFCQEGTLAIEPPISQEATLQKWNNALSQNGLPGSSRVAKFSSNGANDNFYRSDTGRETIIFSPSQTNFNTAIELVYYFHGIKGFTDDDFSKIVIPQAKKMAEEQRRNIVIVFPELPWSRGLDNSERWTAEGRTKLIWDGTDSDLVQFQKDVINLIQTQFNNNILVTIDKVTLVGHSRGGAALSYAAQHPTTNQNHLSQLEPKPTRITFSEAGYAFGGENPYKVVYNNYIKSNSNSEMAILVQHPSRKNSAHDPTVNAINFVNEVKNDGWTVETEQKGDYNYVKSFNTPGADSIPYKIPNTNIWYVPLNQGHDAIAQEAIAWTSS